MAKHNKNKTVSKGLRTSCYGNKKAITKPVAGSHNTAMLEAFLSTPLTDVIRFSRLGNIVIKEASKPVKLSADQAKGWSTTLSFRTFKALQQQGVLV